MKKIYAALLLACSGYAAKAQISEARLPQSMLVPVVEPYIPLTDFPLPDWETARDRFDREAAKGVPGPFLFGLPVATDLSFPASGIVQTLPDGRRIWRTRIRIAGAPAIGFYYDKFRLPEGVSFFLSNENGKHILGAYTSRNNSEDGLFANEAVQGGLVNLELDMEPGVSLDAIRLHIDKLLVYFRSCAYLNQYLTEDGNPAKPTDADTLGLEGSSALCNIDAVCPPGLNYPTARKATVQTLYPDGSCSATMINNTGNTTADCRQYLLTATHCEGSNSTDNTAFSQVLIRYNFERPQCGPGAAAQVNTLTGAFFRARANYVAADPPSINGDFLLLEVKDKIPAAWDVYFAGWNRSDTMPASLSYPEWYIGFHHPSADVKKIAASHTISPDGDAGGSMGSGTHWQMFPIDSGGIEGGSSGSGLFDGSGRLIGIASVAGGPDADCAVNASGHAVTFYTYVQYSKLSLDWDYSLDGISSFRQLKPWLDPGNTGVVTLDAVRSDCSSAGNGIAGPVSGISDNAIAVTPNPSTDGMLKATISFPAPVPLWVTVFNMTGVRQAAYYLGKVQKGSYSFDLGACANGIYLMKFNNGYAITTKKVVLAR